jgi:hypothetical protein
MSLNVGGNINTGNVGDLGATKQADGAQNKKQVDSGEKNHRASSEAAGNTEVKANISIDGTAALTTAAAIGEKICSFLDNLSQKLTVLLEGAVIVLASVTKTAALGTAAGGLIGACFAGAGAAPGAALGGSIGSVVGLLVGISKAIKTCKERFEAINNGDYKPEDSIENMKNQFKDVLKIAEQIAQTRMAAKATDTALAEQPNDSDQLQVEKFTNRVGTYLDNLENVQQAPQQPMDQPGKPSTLGGAAAVGGATPQQPPQVPPQVGHPSTQQHPSPPPQGYQPGYSQPLPQEGYQTPPKGK